MQTRMKERVIAALMTIGLVGLTAGCASIKGDDEKEGTRTSLAQLSEPARATVQRVTAGGQIEKIDREVEKGKAIYDVEANVGGKHVEYTIAEADGAVLGTETEITFAELPPPVRAAAEKFFGTATGLKAMKGVEEGKTSYEIEGTRNGKKTEATFDPNGKRIE